MRTSGAIAANDGVPVDLALQLRRSAPTSMTTAGRGPLAAARVPGRRTGRQCADDSRSNACRSAMVRCSCSDTSPLRTSVLFGCRHGRILLLVSGPESTYVARRGIKAGCAVTNVRMPTHEINLKIAKAIEVVNKDVEVVVYEDDRKLGRLRISRGSIDWTPVQREAREALRWSAFDAAHGAREARARCTSGHAGSAAIVRHRSAARQVIGGHTPRADVDRRRIVPATRRPRSASRPARANVDVRQAEPPQRLVTPMAIATPCTARCSHAARRIRDARAKGSRSQRSV